MLHDRPDLFKGSDPIKIIIIHHESTNLDLADFPVTTFSKTQVLELSSTQKQSHPSRGVGCFAFSSQYWR